MKYLCFNVQRILLNATDVLNSFNIGKIPRIAVAFFGLVYVLGSLTRLVI